MHGIKCSLFKEIYGRRALNVRIEEHKENKRLRKKYKMELIAGLKLILQVGMRLT